MEKRHQPEKMNVKKYTASGILELYVLDLLTESERKSVEENMKLHQKIREEVMQIEDALEAYCSLFAKTPPEDSKREILRKISSETGF